MLTSRQARRRAGWPSAPSGASRGRTCPPRNVRRGRTCCEPGSAVRSNRRHASEGRAALTAAGRSSRPRGSGPAAQARERRAEAAARVPPDRAGWPPGPDPRRGRESCAAPPRALRPDRNCRSGLASPDRATLRARPRGGRDSARTTRSAIACSKTEWANVSTLRTVLAARPAGEQIAAERLDPLGRVTVSSGSGPMRRLQVDPPHRVEVLEV